MVQFFLKIKGQIFSFFRNRYRHFTCQDLFEARREIEFWHEKTMEAIYEMRIAAAEKDWDRYENWREAHKVNKQRFDKAVESIPTD